MSIPLATTTITITRVDSTADGYDAPPAPTTIDTGVRAVIGSPSGSQNLAAGDRVVATFQLTCDPTDIKSDDTVIDETTGEQYRVAWARTQRGLGLDHTTGALRQVTGAST